MKLLKHLTKCSVDCKNNNTVSEIGQQPKQCFILRLRLSPYQPQLSQENGV